MKLSRAVGMRELYRACCAITVIIGVISDKVSGLFAVFRCPVEFNRLEKCVFSFKYGTWQVSLGCAHQNINSNLLLRIKMQ